MASFDEAIKTVLKHEGGFVNNPNDRGGATNYGISFRFLSNCDKDELKVIGVTFNDSVDDIKNLTEENAKKIYYKFWWDKFEYYRIVEQKVANKIFDAAVNSPTKAHKLIQEAVNTIIDMYPIKVDGIFGKRTIAAINIVNSDKLLAKYRELLSDFYRELCGKNEELRIFLRGWLNRAND